MKPTKIEFSFDDSKLEAIHLFLKDKDTTLGKELEVFMDGLYKKVVPPQVRSYIEMKEAEPKGTDAPAKAPKRRTPSGAVEPVCDALSDEAGTRPPDECPG